MKTTSTMTKEQFCKKHGLTEDQFLGKEKISGYLPLGNQSHYKRDKNNEEYYDIMC